MSYVSQEDVILYVDSITTFAAGDDCPIRLVLYKDYLNTQLDLSKVDAITVTIFDDVGRRVLSYASPEIPGKTLPMTIGDAANGQEGFIEFILEGIHNQNFIPNDVYATVGLVWVDYYPEPKTITTPKLKNEELTKGPPRLALANWLTDKDNPLTSRVFVNRLWKHFFGRGLSRVLDDFGSQGTAPTHPELLDWLAAEFMDSGWDIKHMVRLITTSQAYRQSSKSSRILELKDPYNQLIARQARYRLDAELIRDNALAVSGLLIQKIGGKSVKPYQPAGYWANLHFPQRTYKHDTGSAQYRRGLYTHWQRQFLHPALLAFDAPSREECTAERPRSNTPIAALVMLNDPSQIEAARSLAEHILKRQIVSLRDQFNALGKQVLSRPFNNQEQILLAKLLREHIEEFESNPTEANKLINIGLTPYTTEIPEIELAAWISVTRTVLNLHETITRN